MWVRYSHVLRSLLVVADFGWAKLELALPIRCNRCLESLFERLDRALPVCRRELEDNIKFSRFYPFFEDRGGKSDCFSDAVKHVSSVFTITDGCLDSFQVGEHFVVVIMECGLVRAADSESVFHLLEG